MSNQELHIFFLNVSKPIVQHFPEMYYKAKRLEGAYAGSGMIGDIERVTALQPDILLVDIEFENQEAIWQRIQYLKQHTATAAIPMLLCMGQQQPLPWSESFLRSQGIWLIARPFTRDKLLEVVSQIALVRC
jgi:CheY-like chemotaxis protein